VNVFVVPVYVVRWTTEPCNESADHHKRRQHCHCSEVTSCPRVKKSDDQHAASLLLTFKRPFLVVGDVIVEVFNKPKMMKKVLNNVSIYIIICFALVFPVTLLRNSNGTF